MQAVVQFIKILLEICIRLCIMIAKMWKPEVVFFEEEKRIHTGRALSGGCHNWCTRSGIYSDLQ